MILNKIHGLFSRSGIEIDDFRARQFDLYYRLINENNDDNDLTRIKGEDNFVIKHFIDSVYYTRFIELPGSLVDIGTGAGFPGIPLKIMFPGLRLVLAEQRKRRIEFLKLAVKELGLKDVDFYPHKVTEKSFFETSGVITRALEDAPETLSRVEHFLPEGGRVILLKGPDAQGDIDSLSEKNRSSYEIETDRDYTLPGTDYMRKILVFRKISSSYGKTYSIMKDESKTRGTAVTSADNRTYKELRRLEAGEGLKKSGTISICGKKIITDYMAGRTPGKAKLILPDGYTEKDRAFDSLIGEFEDRGALYILKKGLFNEVDILGNRSPFLVTDMPAIGKWDGTFTDGCNPVIPFQDPSNVGAAVRSAAAFGVKRIILLKGAASPYHPRAVRASSGAVFEMEFVSGPSLGEFTPPADNIRIFALDRGGADIGGIEFPERFILIPGLEGPGIPEIPGAERVEIPVSEKVESLNAAVAFSVFLYEWNRYIKK